MKKFTKISAIVIGITATAVAGVLFLNHNTDATSANYSAVVEEYVAETTVYDAAADQAEAIVEVATVEEVTEAPTTEEVTEAPTTEEATEAPTTEEATEAPTTEAATEAPSTEAATEAPTTEPATEAPSTEAATEAPKQTSTFTDLVFKDGADGSTHNFANMEDAKSFLKNIDTLTASEAKDAAKANERTYAEQVDELLNLINAYRKANGLSAVTLKDNLTDAAMVRAAESAYANWNMTAYENGNKRHIRPNFEKASSIASEYGISGNFAEIYARYFDSAEGALSGWQGSSAHNAVLVGNYSTVGIGIATASNGDMYWIAIFN